MANFERKETIVFSDLDGTANVHYPMYNPRNVTKFPLQPLVGYDEFLQGVQEVAAFGGFISRRPTWRSPVTRRTLQKHNLGLTEGATPHVWHTWSESRKAALLLGFAREHGVVGMIEDKPHKLGAEILKASLRDASLPAGQTVIGVVTAGRGKEVAEQRIAKLEELARDLGFTLGRDARTEQRIFFLPLGGMLRVGMVDYTRDAGAAFAQSVDTIRRSSQAASQLVG